MPEKQPKEQPYHVRVVGVGGPAGFVYSTETEDMAQHDATRRNTDAEALGIKARYEVVKAS